MTVGGSGNGGRVGTAGCCAIVPGRGENLRRISGVKGGQFGGWGRGGCGGWARRGDHAACAICDTLRVGRPDRRRLRVHLGLARTRPIDPAPTFVWSTRAATPQRVLSFGESFRSSSLGRKLSFERRPTQHTATNAHLCRGKRAQHGCRRECCSSECFRARGPRLANGRAHVQRRWPYIGAQL